MMTVGTWIQYLVVTTTLAAQATTRPASLDAACPVDWRGASLAQALSELSGRLGVPCILDASVGEEAKQRRLRMTAKHLSGAEAFRWTARLAGLEAVLVDGTFLVASTDRIPAVWRTRDQAAPGHADPRWLHARQRRATIQWIDTPPSGVAADVSAEFGLDMIFDPGLLEEPRLVCLEGGDLDLDRVLELLAGQLSVKFSFTDGALWARPAGAEGKASSASRPGAGPAPLSLPQASSRPVGGLSAWVHLDGAIESWQAFGAQIQVASGMPCSVGGLTERTYPRFQTQGPVRDVLEAARLLGWLDWRVQNGSPGNTPLLQVEVRGR